MAHTISPRLHAGKFHVSQLDGNRIAAEAGVIALHVAVLLLLLVPMAAPPMLPEPERKVIEIVDFTPMKPVTHEKPPEKVEVKPRTEASPTPVSQPQKVETQQPVVEAFDGDIPTDPVVIAKVEIPTIPSIGKPLQGAHLEYLTAPPPPYPPQAARENATGTVLLRVLVDIDGKPLEVQIERSSGHRLLDVAARKQVLARWRFQPAMRDGSAVQAIGLVPIDFALNR